MRACKIREEAGGVLTNVSTGQPFSYKDACVEYGPHLGHDPEATRQAQQAVTAFVRTVFKLN